MNLPCILCDLQSEGRGDFGWVHDRSLWEHGLQNEMARAHNLRWSGLQQAWVPMEMDREWPEESWLDDGGEEEDR